MFARNPPHRMEANRQSESDLRMLDLMESFPTLHQARALLEGVWDPSRLDRWACGPEASSGALWAARFVLSVWNPKAVWECGRFDVHQAYHVWDDQHVAAFAAWARAPWYP